MRTIQTTLLAASLALGLAACGSPQDGYDEAATPPAGPASTPADIASGMTTAPAAHTVAVLSATEGNSVTGEIAFAAVDGGVAITGQVNGLPPGSEHGFHVHETGDCSAPDGTSAGGHFNPAATAHGRIGSDEHHVGDTDNLMSDDTGVAVIDTRLQGATLADGAPTDVLGRAVIVHADPDDYTTQPTGNAGARLACGVITQAM
ncbi:superoxide dismutase family protein [Luteimonas terricola]|uniref:Superoxide dismutase [Cu-Zn] n=1 Tax=Luteimonas terricola TaxID=645597 RepID=A0ABQ2EPL2_9GAMM|nr:superoxide dismutase family protein [Luteimonas terricola]GGK16263.1 superoxide dismutase [Cu-Zn] [Luteimonas terricola]